MTEFQSPYTLRQHRPLLLACEAIGWLHMTGKARNEFLRNPEKNAGKQWYHALQVPLHLSLAWLGPYIQQVYKNWKLPGSPPTLENLLKSMFEDFAEKQSKKNLVGLLQAGHAMASGIEKNLPSATAKYLRQDVTHMWLSTAFGQPIRNLLADLPELLTDAGWKRLLEQIEQLLTELERLGDSSSASDIEDWWRWRNSTVGPEGWLRKAFSSTLAETRLPNNDVTLFDQSYITAALFKSATTGAILEGDSFPWKIKDKSGNEMANNSLKQQTRWRLLTIGIGAGHYEARAVKIGDWTGARLAMDEFLKKVCKLIEVDLAVGSLLYRDGEVCVFSFPGERFGYDKQGYQGGNLQIADWQSWLTKQIDGYAHDTNLEMPPYCSIGEPSRSLVGMTAEIRKARETMAVPLHRNWQLPGQSSSDGHVCPVCLVRRSRSGTDKQRPCDLCKARRTHRLDKWLKGEFGSDSVWISEVADANDRVALVTMSLDIETWLDGRRMDSLRTQSVAMWAAQNTTVKKPLPEDHDSMVRLVETALGTGNQASKARSLIQKKIAPGLKDENGNDVPWDKFYKLMVEDRANAPRWNDLDETGQAAWLAHQLFRKLASPGRIYRFEQQTEDFFKTLLDEFRAIAAADQNRWRVRRLVIKPDNSSSGSWEDRQTYNGRFGDVPVSLLYRERTRDFLTICNLARLLKPEQDRDGLRGTTHELKSDDSVKSKRLVVHSVADAAGALNVYHPVIPLDLSPVRFRVLLPLEAASTCVDRAIEAWRDQFAQVWDRLPLRVGVVAFPRMTPFQAVIEAVRNIEDELDKIKDKDGVKRNGPETWRVAGCNTREGVTALSIESLDHQHKLLQTIPTRLPDGRDDVFYPYFAVEDRQVRFPLDFQHPEGGVYRHVKDLRSGDGVLVYPSFIATVFMDGTARRFDPLSTTQLTEWLRMRDLWQLMGRHAPSQTALRGAWSVIVQRREAWQGPDGTWFEGGKTAWLDFARAVFHERLGVQGACLEALVQAAGEGLLDWSLEWHMSVLKKQVSGLPVRGRTQTGGDR